MPTTWNDLPASLRERGLDAHKGDFGTCLLIGGSGGMTGAIVLAARAALRSGVGLCRVAVPASRQVVLPIAVPEATSIALPEADGSIAADALAVCLEEAHRARSAGIGPGLGRTPGARAFVAGLVPSVERPLVVDADALDALVGGEGLLRSRRAPTVLTPHPGEAARLLGSPDARAVQADRAGAARELARRTGAIVVLKGAGTLVARGDDLYRNDTGNPGMATGGSGDVLTGILAALLAQGLDPFQAATVAVRVHGLAGDQAAGATTELALVAGDLVEHLPAAWRTLGAR